MVLKEGDMLFYKLIFVIHINIFVPFCFRIVFLPIFNTVLTTAVSEMPGPPLTAEIIASATNARRNTSCGNCNIMKHDFSCEYDVFIISYYLTFFQVLLKKSTYLQHNEAALQLALG